MDSCFFGAAGVAGGVIDVGVGFGFGVAITEAAADDTAVLFVAQNCVQCITRTH